MYYLSVTLYYYDMPADKKEFNELCRLTTFVKPKTKKTVTELARKLGVSRSEIVCNILEKHLITMEAIKK